jgi:outer membrane protein TolC
MKTPVHFLVVALAVVLFSGTAMCGEAPANPATPAPPTAPKPAAAEKPAAAPDDVVHLTLDDAVWRALRSAERIGAARAGYERSGASVLESYSGILPNVSAIGSLTRTKTEIQTVNGISLPARSSSNLYNAQLQATQPLFTGGAVYYGVKAAR